MAGDMSSSCSGLYPEKAVKHWSTAETPAAEAAAALEVTEARRFYGGSNWSLGEFRELSPFTCVLMRRTPSIS